MVDSLVQSLVDQHYHSADPLGRSTTETLLGVQRQHSPLKDCTAPLQYRYGNFDIFSDGPGRLSRIFFSPTPPRPAVGCALLRDRARRSSSMLAI